MKTLAFFMTVSALHGTDIYVNQSATGAETGTSWVDAYTSVQSALGSAVSGDQIHVAEGKYFPSATDRSASFKLVPGVSMQGGYPHDAALLTDPKPNPAIHATTLSGDINDTDSLIGNSYHVVISAASADSNTRLSGFTITSGNAEGGGENSRGGGLMLSGSPVVSNCFISSNSAEEEGGGIYTDGSPSFLNCRILNGFAATGGGLFVSGGSPICKFLVINSCSAGKGGAIAVTGNGAPSFLASEFSANSADLSGGGLYLTGKAISRFNSCIVSGNHSEDRGGGLFQDRGVVTIESCTFHGNLAESSKGGAIYTQLGTTSIANSIIWGNLIVDEGGGASVENASYFSDGSDLSISYSLIEYAQPDGDENLDGTDPANTPQFLRSVDALDAPTRLADVLLLGDSPCLNRGSNALSSVLHDARGERRVQGERIDLGAIEQKVIYVNDTATGLNNGTSWANAFVNLQDALTLEPEYTAIYLAEGVYYPHLGGISGLADHERFFQLENGNTLRGGYPDNASLGLSPASRPYANFSILSGDLGMDDASGGTTANSMNGLLKVPNTSPLVLIDGLHFTASHSTALDVQRSARVTDCFFYGNSDDNNGAAIATPITGGGVEFLELRSCRFHDNHCDDEGGAISASLLLGKLQISSCSFKGNSAGVQGGCISSACPTTIVNCEFQGNYAPRGSAIYCATINRIEVLNASFQGNRAGGALSGTIAANVGDVSVTNSLFGIDIGGAFEKPLDPRGLLRVAHCFTLDGPWPGEGNHVINPAFREKISPSDAPIVGGDLRLQGFSRALDSGNTSVISESLDLVGNSRVINGAVDRGAFEVQEPDFELLWLTDFDQDGLSFGLEFMLGRQTGIAEPLEELFVVRGGDRFDLLLERNQAATEFATLWLMASPTMELGTWSRMMNLSERESVNDLGLMTIGDKGFYRIEARLKEDDDGGGGGGGGGGPSWE